MSSFDPNKLDAKPASGTKSQRPTAERIHLVVDSYETPQDAPHYAVGHTLGNPDEQIRVRLNTVKERSEDKPKVDPAAIESQYKSGENHRESLADKAKGNIKLIAFDDARQIEDVDGMKTYRAHWPKTMATSPESEVVQGMAHIRLKDAKPNGNDPGRAQAYVEMLKSSATVDSNNVVAALSDALEITDEKGRARDVSAMIRVYFEDRPLPVATARLYPATEQGTRFDQDLGENKNISVPQPAEKTLKSLMEAAPGKTDFSNQNLDVARAIVAGLSGMDEPKFNSTDANTREQARNLYYGAKDGHFTVEVVAIEKIDFGADSRKTYLKDKEKPHLAAYTIQEPAGDNNVRSYSGYADTTVAINRYPNGQPYAVYASPSDMYPKMTKLNDIGLGKIGAELTSDVQAKVQPEPIGAPAYEEEEEAPAPAV